MKTTTTWLCPGCGASTVQPMSPGICPSCQRRAMVLWNISEHREPVSPMSIAYPDFPVSRWLEDRAERQCLLCTADLSGFDPEAFVAMVFKEGMTFCIGAACEPCALKALEDGTVRPATMADVAIILPENPLAGAVAEETAERPLRMLQGGKWVPLQEATP
jgi:hypothetical protein